jgi:hypothetical protein
VAHAQFDGADPNLILEDVGNLVAMESMLTKSKDVYLTWSGPEGAGWLHCPIVIVIVIVIVVVVVVVLIST